MDNSNTGNKMDFVVVGAGVIGISTAFRLFEINPNFKVTVLSKSFPDDGLIDVNYTSNKAGAHFRPFPSKDENELRDSKLTHLTYKKFLKLSESNPETSIRIIDGYDFIEFDNKFYKNLSQGYTEIIEDFKLIKDSDLPGDAKFGAKYKTFSVNPYIYMKFLIDLMVSKKFKIELVQKYVSSLKQVSELYPNSTIINCTGLGLQYSGCNLYDPKSFKIRGQILLVRPPKKAREEGCFNKTVTYQLSNGEWNFIIPRILENGEQSMVLGGSKTLNNLNKYPIKGESLKIINNAKSRFPELFHDDGNLDIIDTIVGFRPARETGVLINTEFHDNVKIVNCYGFGGSGVEMSWGAAVKAADLAVKRNVKL